MAFEALNDFFKTATEADFDRLKAGVLKSIEPTTECVVVPPAYDVALVKLQDDEALVERAAMLTSGLDPEETEWPEDFGDIHKRMYRSRARNVLAMIDDLQGQRLYKITMPKPTDDAATLRAMFGEPDPGLGPQLRDLDDETGAFDVLNEHYRKPRT
jgi:hypothetical protein